MKFRKKCVVILVVAVALVLSTSQQRGVATQRENPGRLQLRTKILAERYCLPNTLELTLELNFTNSGSEPLILYKDSSVIGSYMVSQDAKASEKKDYEIKVSPMKTLTTSGLRPDPPEESHFVILNPSQSHDLQEVFYLNLPEDRANERSFLTPGTHGLQLSIWTWYYSRRMADEYRQRWKEKGILWSQPITSEPMPFIIASGRNAVRCTG